MQMLAGRTAQESPVSSCRPDRSKVVSREAVARKYHRWQQCDRVASSAGQVGNLQKFSETVNDNA
jgi:hypothetical protein